MQDVVISLLNQFGYFGIGLLMAIENVFPPIPSEVILTFSGFLTTISSLQPFLVIISATIGSVVGALILYYIGFLIPVQSLKSALSGKIGQRMHLKSSDLSKAGLWFVEKGNLAVFLCRFVPIVRSLISIPAGTAHMNLGTFLFLTAAGTAIWNTLLVCLGSFAGASWETIVGYMNVYSIIAVVLIGMVFLAIAYRIYTRRFKHSL
jgi:membrane protein DedA with SNARE-associated domain